MAAAVVAESDSNIVSFGVDLSGELTILRSQWRDHASQW